MKTIAVLLLIALAIAGAAADNHDGQPVHYGDQYDGTTQRLQQALNAALAEVIALGEYEAIFNAWLGYGNYQVPDLEDCRRAVWPTNADSDDAERAQYRSLRLILQTGQIVVAGAPTPVFAIAQNGFIVDGAEYWLVRAMVQRISVHYGVPITLLYIDATAGAADPVFDKTNLLISAVADLPPKANFAIGATAQSVYVKKQVYQGCPYFTTYLSAVRTSLDPRVLVSTVWDMQISGVKTGVIAGTQAHLWALNALPQENIFVFNSYDLGVLAIERGAVHVFVADRWQVDLILDAADDTQDMKLNLSAENYVFMTRFLHSSAAAAAVSVAVLAAAFVAAVFF